MGTTTFRRWWSGRCGGGAGASQALPPELLLKAREKASPLSVRDEHRAGPRIASAAAYRFLKLLSR